MLINPEDAEQEVLWAGFDKLECERNLSHQVLLLGYQSGFQVWDVEDPNNVHNKVSKYDGAVSFMRVLPKPTALKPSQDEYADSHPLLVICADESFSADGNGRGGLTIPCCDNIKDGHEQSNGGFVPTVVWFYSLRSQSYIKELKFRSVVYSIRSSSRVVAVLQAAQVHCFEAATLQRKYTILTNPVVTSCLGFGNIGLGPLALGPRWIAYSGSVTALQYTCINPQHLTHSASCTAPCSNGSMVAHYAKQSSKQLAAGIVTLGDIGYKKLYRYCSELLPDSNSQLLSNPGWKNQGTPNGHSPDADSIGMVIVRDVVSKSVIAQFKAHESPIALLCFDPSGTILVTASVQGHNFNVFRIMPELSGSSCVPESGASYIHLYRLQRGFTDAVIQDISFSVNSHWIMVSSSRGTSHLFAISPSGGPVNIQSAEACLTTNNRGNDHNATSKPTVLRSPILGSQMLNQHILRASGPPITLSAVSRIRSRQSGWRNMVTGAAVAASGRMNSHAGAIACTFHKHKCKSLNPDLGSLMPKFHILVFSPSGCVIQYALRLSSELGSVTVTSGLNTSYEPSPDCESRLVVEPIEKWNICQKQNRREREDNVDIYGENGYSDSKKVFAEGIKKEKSDYFEGRSKAKKEHVNPKEGNHMYISEAEIQMHLSRIPLWSRSQISFQSLMIDRIIMDEENNWTSEFEIEKIPTHTIEVRSRDLVPAVGNVQGSKVQIMRVPALDCNRDGGILHQVPGLSKHAKLPFGSSCGPLYSVTGAVVASGKADYGNDEIGWDALRMPIENTKGFVNNNDSPVSHSRHETVNNRESSASETQSELVNNSIERAENEEPIPR